MKQLALLIGIGLPSVAHAEDASEAKHAALVAVFAKQACIPPVSVVVDRKQKQENNYEVLLHQDGAAAIACAYLSSSMSAKAPAFACVSIDPASGALASRPPQLFAGNSYQVPSACALGYCRPNEKAKSDGSDLIAFSNDNTKLARVASDQDAKLEIYDVKTKKRLHAMTLEGGYNAADLIFHGDFVFATGYAAGPDGGVWMYNASKGKFIGTVGEVATGEDSSYVNISSGSYAVVDNALVVSDGGYEEARVDLTTGKITMRKLPRPAACTEKAWGATQEYDQIGDAGGAKPPAKCVQAVRAAQKTFWKVANPTPDAGFTKIGDKRYKLVHDKKGASLQVLDANATKPRTIKLATCKIK
jgi:hypothetical protein